MFAFFLGGFFSVKNMRMSTSTSFTFFIFISYSVCSAGVRNIDFPGSKTGRRSCDVDGFLWLDVGGFLWLDVGGFQWWDVDGSQWLDGSYNCFTSLSLQPPGLAIHWGHWGKILWNHLPRQSRPKGEPVLLYQLYQL